MIYSLNEIDAHCKKAARGAGCEWGYAEDIGKTARWLAAFELSGVHLIANYLTQASNTTLSPPILNSPGPIHAGDKNLCPIQTGCYLTDISSARSGQKHSFARLGFPLLLLPFLSRLADQAKLSVHYLYDDNQFHYGDGKLKYNTAKTLACDYSEHAKCIFTSEPGDGQKARVIGQEVPDADWGLLNNYACKTYVPATEASRRGAGPSE